jgi:hypothetical protein
LVTRLNEARAGLHADSRWSLLIAVAEILGSGIARRSEIESHECQRQEPLPHFGGRCRF